MESEQSGIEENGKRQGEEMALDQSEVPDSEEKCKVQAYTVVTIFRMEDKKKTILRIEDKKIFHNTDQNPKSEYRGQVIYGLVFENRRIRLIHIRFLEVENLGD